MNIWNQKDLPAPPTATYRAEDHNIDINSLLSTVFEALATFNNQNQLEREAAILSRCIYRMKMKFRSDKGLKCLEKVNRGLLQVLRMQMPNLLKTFHNMTPKAYTQNTYFPTLNMLHYILVKIQGLSRLLVRIGESCISGAYFLQNRIHIGHLWKIALVFLAVVSRIFRLTRELIKSCCKSYAKLLPFTKKLKNTGVQWLPVDYELPHILESWLDVKWLEADDDVMIIEEPKLQIAAILDLMDSDSDVEFCDEYVDLDLEDELKFISEYVELDSTLDETQKDRSVIILDDSLEPKDIKPNISHYETNKSVIKTEDIGEAVTSPQPGPSTQNTKGKSTLKTKYLPQTLRYMLNKERRHKVITRDQLIEGIKSIQDVHLLLKEFEKLQRVNHGLFKEMDKLQRSILRKLIKKTLIQMRKCKGRERKHACISDLQDILQLTLKST